MIKSYELYKLSKKVLNEGSIRLLESNSICSKLTCKECIFSSYNNPRCKNCGSDTEEYYKEVAKSYIKFYEDFEPVDEIALEIEELEVQEELLDIEVELEEINEKKEVKSMRSLRERVLGKVNYKSIAEQIWDRLEDEIIDEISYSLDEDSIVDDMIYHYKRDYIDVAKEVLIEEFCQDISSDEIEDHIKEIAREKAYE
jgi:hypothetical protein